VYLSHATSTNLELGGKVSVNDPRPHKNLGVTITLGSVGLIRDLSNSGDILQGELDLLSVDIPLEVL
jgi:hypothetical protein